MPLRGRPSRPSPESEVLGMAPDITARLDDQPDVNLRNLVARNVYRRILILENARATSPLNIGSYLLQTLANTTAERKSAQQDVVDLKRDPAKDRCLNQALLLEAYITALVLPDERADRVRRHVFKWCELTLGVNERATILNEVRRFGRGRR